MIQRHLVSAEPTDTTFKTMQQAKNPRSVPAFSATAFRKRSPVPLDRPGDGAPISFIICLVSACTLAFFACCSDFGRIGESIGLVWQHLLAGSASLQGAPAPFMIPTHPVRTTLVLVHVIGLVAGMGSALLLDAYLLSRLYHRPIETHTAAFVHFGARMVAIGLAILWISGIGLLAFYGWAAPEALANPKIWAKIAIVLLLTANGGLLHRAVLPRLSQRIGKPLLSDAPLGEALLPLAAGAISATSWMFPAALGLIKELNYTVPALTILSAYMLLLAGGLSATILAHILMRATHAHRTLIRT